jgi:erythromycin esterase
MKYFIITLFLSFSLQAAEPNQWLLDHLVPLKTVEAGKDSDDLQPLKQIFKDVQVVALGEATHGTREFFQLKHRLLEFLVKEMGFRFFVLEASYDKCLKINDYVLYGLGRRDEALKNQGYWVWDTREVAEMIDWMRAYNEQAAPHEKVQFLGMDMQRIDGAYGRIEEYLRKIHFEKIPQALSLFQKVQSTAALTKMPSQEIKQLRSDLLELIDFFTAHHPSSEAEFKQTCRLFQLLIQQVEFRAGMDAEGLPDLVAYIQSHPELMEAFQKDPAILLLQESQERYPELKTLFDRYPDLCHFLRLDDFHGRDYHMAQNVLATLKEQPDARIVVWAHNFHIKKSDESQSLGACLKESLGNRYYALGFTFAEGSFRAAGERNQELAIQEFTLPPAPENTFSHFLAQAKVDLFLLDFNGSAPIPSAIPLPFVSIGASFPEGGSWDDCLYKIPAAVAFNGIVFVKETQAAMANDHKLKVDVHVVSQ